MKKLIQIIILTLGISALADSKCDLIEKASLSMPVHASNYFNASTTHTPEGGPYQYLTVKCKNGCRISQQPKTLLKYEPQHPDANGDGYVTYPDINKEKELRSLTVYGQILKEFGNTCPWRVKIINNKTSTLVEYKTGKIKLDVINFKPDGSLSSWLRETSDDQGEVYNF